MASGGGTVDLNIAALISGAGGIVKVGAGTLALTGSTANTNTGATNVNEGTLLLAKTANAYAAPLVIGDFNGTDTVRVLSGTNQLNTQAICGNAGSTLDLTPGGEVQTVNLAGATAGNFQLTLVIGANSQTTGLIPFNATAAQVQTALSALTNLPSPSAVAVVGAPGVNNTAGLYTVFFQGGLGNQDITQMTMVTTGLTGTPTTPVATVYNGTAVIPGTIGALELRGGTVTTGTSTLTLGGNVTALPYATTTATISGNLLLNATRNFLVADSGATAGLNVPAVIAGATFGITKLGGGTLTLSGTGANTFTGTTTVNEGTLVLSKTGGLAIPGNLVVGDFLGGSGTVKGDVVRLSTNNQILSNAAVTVNNAGLLDLNGSSDTIGTLTMTGGSVSTGSGTITLSGNVSGLANIMNRTPATISGNLSLGGATRIFDVQAGALTGSNTNDMVISATIRDGIAAAGLLKNNSGKLQLTGNNTYTDPTIVNSGTLLVDGSQPSSAVTVTTGATLGGTGTAGTLSVVGGTVNPGDPTGGTGRLNAGAADFSTGKLSLQVAGYATPGTSYDRVNLGSSSVTLGGSSTLTLDLAGLAASGTATGVILYAGRTGTFTNVAVINNPNNLSVQLDYKATSLDVVVAAPLVAHHLEFGQQPTNTAVGQMITPPITVRVVNLDGTLITSDTSMVTLALGANPGGGTLGGTLTVQAVGGIATFSNLSINVIANGYTLSATDGSLLGATSNPFNITTPPVAHHLAFGQQPTNTVAGANITPAVTVRIVDQNGGLVATDASFVTVMLVNAAGVTLGGTTTKQAVGGIATFNDLQITTAGNYTLRAVAGSLIVATSNTFSITPAAAHHLGFSQQPTNTMPGQSITPAVRVQVLDAFNNLVTTDNSTVTLAIGNNAAGDALLSGTKSVQAVGGVATFSNLSINKAANGYTLVATDGSLTAATSSAFAIIPLQVTSLTPTDTGFKVTFNRAFDTSTLNLYDASSAFGVADVTLAGTKAGNTNVRGSLLLDTATNSITFIKTGTGTTGVLTDDTYTVTIRSGSNAFHDTENIALDGNSDLTAGDNYTNGFIVGVSATPILGLPDFARGPDGSSTIKVTNNLGTGIPLTLNNALNLSDATFTLTYDPALLNISGTLNGSGTFTLVSNAGGVASLSFHSASPLNGTVTLGQLVAQVPNSAANQYKAKQLLQLGNLLINNASTTARYDNAVHVVAYFGDVNGTGTITGGDAGLVSRVPTFDSGFAAYRLLDPVIIGDINNTGAMDGADATLVNRFVAGIPTLQIPTPPALAITPVGPDPILSIPTDLSVTPGSTVTVPVYIDDPRPAGSTGMTEAVLALIYDPTVFSVSASDVRFGSAVADRSGWKLLVRVDETTGQLGINLFSATSIVTQPGSSLVTIDFHARSTAPAGATPINLAETVNPNGQGIFRTQINDNVGAFILHPVPTDAPNDAGVDGLVVVATPAPARELTGVETSEDFALSDSEKSVTLAPAEVEYSITLTPADEVALPTSQAPAPLVNAAPISAGDAEILSGPAGVVVTEPAILTVADATTVVGQAILFAVAAETAAVGPTPELAPRIEDSEVAPETVPVRVPEVMAAASVSILPAAPVVPVVDGDMTTEPDAPATSFESRVTATAPTEEFPSQVTLAATDLSQLLSALNWTPQTGYGYYRAADKVFAELTPATGKTSVPLLAYSAGADRLDMVFSELPALMGGMEGMEGMEALLWDTPCADLDLAEGVA